MKRSIYFLFIVFSIFIITACHLKSDSYDSNNHPITMADYRGKWVVINYWATWCKPCETEMPELNALYLSSNKKIMVLGVNYDQLSDNDINQFNQTVKVNFPLLQNFPIEKYGIKSINSLPITFLISPKGKLVKTLSGPQTKATILREINKANA